MYTRLFSFLLTFVLFTLSGLVFAQTVTLYDQPNATAKVIGTADLSSGIIPIFTPDKDGEWMKVADPRNGNVGWIKSSDLKNAKGSENTVTFTQKIITNDKPNTYQIIQFGSQPTKMTDKEMKAFLEKMRVEQQSIQNSFQGVLKNMNDVIKRQWDLWNAQGGFPMLIVPSQSNQPASTTTPAPSKASSKDSTKQAPAKP